MALSDLPITVRCIYTGLRGRFTSRSEDSLDTRLITFDGGGLQLLVFMGNVDDEATTGFLNFNIVLGEFLPEIEDNALISCVASTGETLFEGLAFTDKTGPVYQWNNIPASANRIATGLSSRTDWIEFTFSVEAKLDADETVGPFTAVGRLKNPPLTGTARFNNRGFRGRASIKPAPLQAAASLGGFTAEAPGLRPSDALQGFVGPITARAQMKVGPLRTAPVSTGGFTVTAGLIRHRLMARASIGPITGTADIPFNLSGTAEFGGATATARLQRNTPLVGFDVVGGPTFITLNLDTRRVVTYGTDGMIASSFALHSRNTLPRDVTSEGDATLVIDSGGSIFEYATATGTLRQEHDISSDRITFPIGISVIGNTTWVLSDGQCWPFNQLFEPIPGRFNLHPDNASPVDLGTDADHLLIPDFNTIFSYDAETGRRDNRTESYDVIAVLGFSGVGGRYFGLHGTQIFEYEFRDFTSAERAPYPWDSVSSLTFSPRDGDGADVQALFRDQTFDVGNLVVALRRVLNDAGTIYQQVAFQMTADCYQNDDGTWTFPVTRATIGDTFDHGDISRIDPPLDSDYDMRFLLPTLSQAPGFPFGRKPSWFFAEVSAAVATQLDGIQDTQDWPDGAVETANDATPGINVAGDIVTLYRGGVNSVRAWNAVSNKWEVIDQLIDGNLLVHGSANLLDVAVGGRIVSSGYVPQTSGWAIEQDGGADFDTLALRGLIDLDNLPDDVKNARELWSGEAIIGATDQLVEIPLIAAPRLNSHLTMVLTYTYPAGHTLSGNIGFKEIELLRTQVKTGTQASRPISLNFLEIIRLDAPTILVDYWASADYTKLYFIKSLLAEQTDNVKLWRIFETVPPQAGQFGNPVLRSVASTATITRTPQYRYFRGASAPDTPTGGRGSETHVPNGWTSAELEPTATADVWRVRRILTYASGVFVSASDYGDMTINKGFRDVTETRTQTRWRRSATAPNVPTGGANNEGHVPAGWSTTELQPTATLNVYRITRVATYTNGAFTSATAWGSRTKVADATGVVTTRTQYRYRRAATQPNVPTGGTGNESHVPTGWSAAALTATTTQSVWRISRVASYNNNTFTSATAWGDIEEWREKITTSTARQTIYTLSAFDPTAPAGGTNSESHLPRGWVSNEPNPQLGLGVYSADRVLTYEDGVFASATAWGNVSRVTPPLVEGPPAEGPFITQSVEGPDVEGPNVPVQIEGPDIVGPDVVVPATSSFDFNVESGRNETGIAFGEGKFYVLENGGSIRVYNADGTRSSGDDFKTRYTHNNNGIAFYDGHVYITTWQVSTVHAYSVSTGARVTSRDFSGSGSAVNISYGSGRFWIAERGGSCKVWDSDGTRDSDSDFRFGFYADGTVVVDGLIYGTASNLRILAFNIADGSRSTSNDWTRVSGDSNGRLTYANGRFYGLSNTNNKVYAYESDGSRTTSATTRPGPSREGPDVDHPTQTSEGPDVEGPNVDRTVEGPNIEGPHVPGTWPT